MLKWIGLLGAAALLPACATRGTLDIECAEADLKRTALEPSQLVQDIQSGKPVAEPLSVKREDGTSLASKSAAQVAEEAALVNAFVTAGGEPRHSLLLSGGGQWGAYGAGFLAALEEGGKMPDFERVTGVSTGALQALFVGALNDSDLGPQERKKLTGLLMASYRPAAEREIVYRHGWKGWAVISGSFAGLTPLRDRIYGRLCDSATECPLIRHLANSTTEVLVGYVGASDGVFYYSNITEIARIAYPDGRNPGPPGALKRARQCIAGAALASAAMPVFFQQVRIGSGADWKTYYDGGVRQSVFEANAAERVDRVVTLMKERREQEIKAQLNSSDKDRVALKSLTNAELPALYVLRNGPTVLIRKHEDAAFDRKGNALDAALRAQTILVNQLEVQSIADLRLAHPKGYIWLRTADGFDRKPETDGEIRSSPPRSRTPDEVVETRPCVKNPPEAMFSPSFMGCLMRYGREHGAKGNWIRLSELDLKPRAESGQ